MSSFYRKEINIMRKIELDEIISYRCHTCGSNNKLYGDLVYIDGEVHGHIMRCCNCGRMTFFTDYNIDPAALLNHKLTIKNYGCIKNSDCDHADCVYKDNSLIKTEEVKQTNNSNENSVSEKLTVKNYSEPRFL